MPSEFVDYVGATSEVADYVDAWGATMTNKETAGWMLVAICAVAGILAVGLKPDATVADWMAAISVAAGGVACALGVTSKFRDSAGLHTDVPKA